MINSFFVLQKKITFKKNLLSYISVAASLIADKNFKLALKDCLCYLFQNTLSDSLLHRQSSCHLLGVSSSDDSFHDLKNNFEEHLKECLRSDLLKIMINI